MGYPKYDDDTPAPRPKIEPSAELRQAASTAYEMYVAMTDAGFTNAQAWEAVLKLILANVGGAK
jgi:hypothetical protein